MDERTRKRGVEKEKDLEKTEKETKGGKKGRERKRRREKRKEKDRQIRRAEPAVTGIFSNSALSTADTILLKSRLINNCLNLIPRSRQIGKTTRANFPIS
ncbi:hypothetical protein ElyMa_006338100 [Elysia marginata]|uniref:Uncharacterized protein n=1 Tax=Elysia marginata TaxID=1093978 RepID=A0AAV4HJC3_9GAST|nr:hypothetical protein ElyMa_006338100 [Elysia marginata]